MAYLFPCAAAAKKTVLRAKKSHKTFADRLTQHDGSVTTLPIDRRGMGQQSNPPAEKVGFFQELLDPWNNHG